MHVSVLLGCKCVQHLRRHIDPFISVSDIYAKISVYEIKIGTLNAALILHQQIMVINDSQGELLTTIIQILVRMVVLAVKYVIFINVYTTPLLKSSLCLPLRFLWANDYKGKGISGRDHYIFCSRVMLGTACTA